MGNEIQERWQEYERFKSVGEEYSALGRVAEIHSCLPKLPHKLKLEFGRRCRKVVLDSKVIESAKAGIREDEERIIRICSIGTKWHAEEFVLLITLQVQIDLLLRFLEDRGFTLRSKTNEECLQAIKHAARSTQNRRAFEHAASLAKRNWGLPIDHELLTA